jgi:hypothetical protein
MKFLKAGLVSAVLMFLGQSAHANYYNGTNGASRSYPSLIISSASAAGGQAQVILSSPTAASANSSGFYNYITHIHIEMYATGTLTGGATPVVCTTTNLTTTPGIRFQTAEATGTEQVYEMDFASPIQAAQASQVAITCPGTASTIWNIVVTYFQAS